MMIEQLQSYLTSTPNSTLLINSTLIIILLYSVKSIISNFSLKELSDESCDETGRNHQSLVTVSDDYKDSYNWRPKTFQDTIVWRSYTPIELSEFNGEQGNRILFAIRRAVYDVTSGKNFYGPGGPYGNFAGRDASRGMAKQSFEEDVLTSVDGPIDELKDLSEAEISNLDEWEQFFRSKYIVCGELIENSERISKPI
ncbi:cytochrome b5-like heme/steroid binding domain-containing protein [Phakopsora pachyrhizi]|uniref:Cytochrome b5-like heme/steroid binding domain-containing protein n=1 Tax=Phakopsora pachyrhizi TaxID=170000 RepID=A0AAV0AM00_PHAPC|nr:cytochrome b5-like heme/steroid binding domain-containing protein [Phakopsora pachyrhizi]CAH7669234.1 cytochrome b5-like heme/steroid binding domain-containing protein [Phakopsora pachyrhizi]